MEHPGVGVGVYIEKEGKFLFGKRLSAFGRGEWCAPGGKLELYEDVFECAQRETLEETGLEIENIRLIGVTNDPHPHHNAHFITLSVAAKWKSGEARLMEPDKFETWEWFSWDSLPQPLIVAGWHLVGEGVNPATARTIALNELPAPDHAE